LNGEALTEGKSRNYAYTLPLVGIKNSDNETDFDIFYTFGFIFICGL